MTGQQRAEGRVQHALASLYVRAGSRVIYVVYAANIVVGLLIGLVTLIWMTRYLALPVMSSGVIAAILLLGGGPGAALVLWSWRDAFRTGLSWTGEARTAQRAPEVWESLARLPYVVARRALVSSLVLMVPFTILAIVVAMDRSWLTAVPFYGCTVISVLASAVLWTFGGEFALRPMLRDIASMLPADFEPTTHGLRLQTRSLLPLPIVSAFGALTAGAFVDATGPGGLRLAVALGVALVTALAASAAFFVITRSTLDPIEDLLDATRRVSAGDINTGVPLVSADEFGRLGYSFNAMLGELRRHRDELRATHARIVTAADAARRGVERDLHDGAQQRLVLLHLNLASPPICSSATRPPPDGWCRRCARILPVRSLSCETSRVGCTRRCWRSKGCAVRSPRRSSARRSLRPWSATGSVAPRPSLKPPSTSAAWRAPERIQARGRARPRDGRSHAA